MLLKSSAVLPSVVDAPIAGCTWLVNDMNGVARYLRKHTSFSGWCGSQCAGGCVCVVTAVRMCVRRNRADKVLPEKRSRGSLRLSIKSFFGSPPTGQGIASLMPDERKAARMSTLTSIDRCRWWVVGGFDEAEQRPTKNDSREGRDKRIPRTSLLFCLVPLFPSEPHW